jgi:hypothetical protein
MKLWVVPESRSVMRDVSRKPDVDLHGVAAVDAGDGVEGEVGDLLSSVGLGGL